MVEAAMTLDEHFHSIFGSRWERELKPALLRPPEKVPLENPFPGAQDQYLLDLASLEPVHALELREGHRFLDLCAAPGGKALAAICLTMGRIAARLNDSSSGRVQRLKAVLYDHLPEDLVAGLRVTCSDGARIGQREPAQYDRVLADVPCSAERHHLLGKEDTQWTLASSKRLSVRQHALLCSALDAAQPGGRVVYATCSLSPLENDGVIAKLRKSRAGQFDIAPPVRTMGEPTEFGTLILPDRHPSFGPIYYAILAKREGRGGRRIRA